MSSVWITLGSQTHIRARLHLPLLFASIPSDDLLEVNMSLHHVRHQSAAHEELPGCMSAKGAADSFNTGDGASVLYVRICELRWIYWLPLNLCRLCKHIRNKFQREDGHFMLKSGKTSHLGPLHKPVQNPAASALCGLLWSYRSSFVTWLMFSDIYDLITSVDSCLMVCFSPGLQYIDVLNIAGCYV